MATVSLNITINTKEKIDILSDYLENNIVFVDSKTRLPFFFQGVSNSNIIESRKTIITLSFDLKHFEIIGKYFPDDRIQRSFMSYDNIVKNINHYFFLIEKSKEIIPTKAVETKENHIKEEEKIEIPIIVDTQHINNLSILNEQKDIQTSISNEKKEEVVEKNNDTHNIVSSNDIKEKIYYNSDDEMLNILGDEL